MSHSNAVNQHAQIGNLRLCQMALTRAIDRSQGLPGLVVFYGPSGWGKSASATALANPTRAYYVQAQSSWTRKHMLTTIMRELGLPIGGTIPEMAEQIGAELAASGRPLIIDEMDHVVDRGLVELVRDIYEASHAAIVLIGEEGLPGKLKRWERMHGRVLAWVAAQPVNLGDAQALRPIYSPDVEIADDLLQAVVDQAHGSVRRVCVNISLIRDEALNAGSDSMTLQSWGKRQFYTGEAPKRRLA